MMDDTVAKQDRFILSRIAPYLVLALMLAASVLLWRFWVNTETARERAHYDEYCERISQDIVSRIDTYRRILNGGAGIFIASEEVDREEWRIFVEYSNTRTSFPDIQGLGFAKVIAPSELSRHVARIRAEGFPEYRVWPEGDRAIYTSIIFLEPFDARNQRAFGYDMFSEPVRRTAMERARDTATPALSGKVHLVQETDEDVQAGYLLYVPVFAGGVHPSGVEARRTALRGYVYGVLRVRDMMRDIFENAPRQVAFELYDGTTIAPEALLFDSHKLDGGSDKEHQAQFSSHTSLELYGHTWSLVFHSTPQFNAEKESRLSWLALAGGLIVSILVFLLLRSQQNIRVKAEALAENLTVDLRESEESLHKLNAELEQRVEERTRELAFTKEAAEEANRAKSAFLANMSHEIRTPLNAVLGFTQILERDASLTPRQTGMLHTIGRSGQHLLNLINDILDMSKIEAGRLDLRLVDFCLYDLLDDLELVFTSRAQGKQLQLLMERDDSVPRYINADEGKLRQVFINLLSNAVKFTNAGGVAVRVRAETATDRSDSDANTIRLVVEVEDSGPGIATEELDSIYEPFRQSAGGQDAGGTGLGLAVSRKLVELMGGSLTVKSEVGKGSLFRFDVLVTPAEAVARKDELEMRQVVGLEPGTGPFRILIVDDQKDNRDLLAALLEPLDFEIREAVNGKEALDVFETWSPHAVLMDMRMPVMDGYEATQRIKETEQGRATPVIAVTASAFDGAEKEVMAVGVDRYVRKPFRGEEILAVLEQCLGVHYVYAETARQAPEKGDVQPLTREDLAALPEELRQAMRQAVDEGDMAKLQELIAQVEETDAATARKLRNVAEQYDYETLTQLLIKQEEGDPDA